MTFVPVMVMLSGPVAQRFAQATHHRSASGSNSSQFTNIWRLIDALTTYMGH